MKTLKILIGTTFCALFLSVAAVQAQPQIPGFGFGLTLGEPTGLTLKGNAGGGNAWDGAIASSWFGSLRIHGDYLWSANVFNSSKVGMYFGLGAAIGFGRGKGVVFKGKGGEWYYYDDEDAFALGARVVGGINAMPFTAPVELFFEVAPIVGLLPATGLGTDVALGIRYYP